MEGESNEEETSSHDEETSSTSSHDFSEDHQIQKQFVGTSGAQWSCLPKLPQNNYVEYLSESSANYLPNPPTITETGNNSQTLGGSSSFDDSGKDAFGFKQIGSSSHVSLLEHLEKGRIHTPYSYSPLTFLKSDPMARTATPCVPNSVRRKQRIADNLKALHELLPNPEVGSQAYILDDIIDYVKYLQSQVKELGGSKLQADSNAIPLVFHEGFGHYIKEQMLSEPLEEIMGKLLEEDPAAASQLLENKGLYLLPIALADDLNQAS